MIESFKDLNAWKEGHRLVLQIYVLTRHFPKDELFGLVSQLRRAVVSITSNLAEGFNRQGIKEKVQFYSMALGSVAEVQNQLQIALDIGYISREQFTQVDEQAVVVHKLVNGLIRSTRTRL